MLTVDFFVLFLREVDRVIGGGVNMLLKFIINNNTMHLQYRRPWDDLIH